MAFDPFKGFVDANPTVADVARRRKLAQTLLGNKVQNGSQLGVIADALAGTLSGYEEGQASRDENAGRSAYGAKLADILAKPDAGIGDYAGLAADEWASPAQGNIASMLMGQEMQQSDPMRQLEMQLKQAQIDAANSPAQPDPTDSYSGRVRIGQEQGLGGDALTEYALTGKLPGGNQTTRAGVGQPIYGRNKQTGAIEPWQSMTDGTMINIANPQADPAQYDFNPGIAAGERSTGTVDAKTAAAARAALPGVEQAYAVTMKTVDSLTGSPNIAAGQKEQFSNTLGIPTGQVVGAIPGTYKSDFRNTIDQLSGQAFLNIRQALKGAGQVTDYEGAKGEIALSKMRAAAERGSEADFNQAVLDYKEAIDNGLRLLREQAQGGYSSGSPNVTGQTNFTYNPATGELE